MIEKMLFIIVLENALVFGFLLGWYIVWSFKDK